MCNVTKYLPPFTASHTRRWLSGINANTQYLILAPMLVMRGALSPVSPYSLLSLWLSAVTASPYIPQVFEIAQVIVRVIKDMPAYYYNPLNTDFFNLCLQIGFLPLKEHDCCPL
jgi:hypothetical protein